jgi:hypothetical protein
MSENNNLRSQLDKIDPLKSQAFSNRVSNRDWTAATREEKDPAPVVVLIATPPAVRPHHAETRSGQRLRDTRPDRQRRGR